MGGHSLERRLGPCDAAAIVIANVVGVGIFTTPALVATIVPNPQALLAAWVCGGALAFAGSLAYAELAARRPMAGGEYVYLRESFGDVAAFLTGWTSFVAGFSGAIAAGAVGVTVYLDRFVPGIAQSKPLAIGIIVALAVVHARGLGPGRALQNALTVLKVGALIAFVAIGFAASSDRWRRGDSRRPAVLLVDTIAPGVNVDAPDWRPSSADAHESGGHDVILHRDRRMNERAERVAEHTTTEVFQSHESAYVPALARIRHRQHATR